MYIVDNFPNDVNKALKHVQHDTYPENVGLLVWTCVQCYVRSAELIGVTTRIYKQILSKDCIPSFDHRTVQFAHDAIAAFYRYSNSSLYKPMLNNHEPYRVYLTSRWLNFYHKEVERIAWDHPLNTAILNSVLHANTDMGYENEHLAVYLLEKSYGPDFEEACRIHRETTRRKYN